METKINIDLSVLVAELIAIRALLWTMAEYNIGDKTKFEAFENLYDKHLASLAQRADELQTNRK